MALEMNGDPNLAEETIREGSAFRNLVAWGGGPLDLANKSQVKSFWSGSVGRKAEDSESEWGVSKQRIAQKNLQILDRYSKVSTRLMEDVRCKICHNVPTSAPLHSCPKGHITCLSCFQGPSSMCPVCNEEMGFSTSLVALTVIKNIQHTCQFDGCQKRMSLAEVEEHKVHCFFRNVICPSVQCKKEVRYDQLLMHVLQQCEFSIARGKKKPTTLQTREYNQGFRSNPDNLCSGKWNVTTLVWKEKYFFLTKNNEEGGKSQNFYIQMLGSTEECSRFKVRISLLDKEGQRVISYLANPFSIYMVEEDKREGGLVVRNKDLMEITWPEEGNEGFSIIKIGLQFEEVPWAGEVFQRH